MSSGVKISEEVLAVYQKMRLHHSGDDYQHHDKFVMFKIKDGMVIVDEDVELKVKDLKGETNVFKKITSMLPPMQCRYALYDCCYETKETGKEDLVFIMWAPDTAPIKQRMIYASSWVSLKKALPGIKHEWQINDDADVKDECAFLEKLGPKGTIKALEGKDV